MNEEKISLSRRSFIDVAVGSLVSLPVLAGGLIMGPTTAHADGNGNIDYDNIDKGDQAPAKYTIIDVVRPYEVGFIAVDVTKVVKDAMGNDSFERLTNKKVHVKVISRYGSKKTAEKDTGNDGVANIDIKQLAENPNKKDVNNLDTYACNATVQVTCEGYRSFETSLMRVTGGTGLMIPLHPADAKGVWPYRASFDEWDVLYTKNQFVQSAALKDDHTLQIVARGIASTDPVTVEMLVDGEDKPRQTVKATPKKGEVTAEFKGHFLQKGDAAAIPVGKIVKIVLRDREAPYAWTLALDIMEAVVDEPASKEKTKLTPFNTAGSSKPGADVKWPSGAPLVSGGSLKFWTPDLPVGLYVNPFGYAQFTLKTPSWGYKSDDGALVKGKWGSFPIKSVKDQWNGMLKDAKLMGDKTNALVSKPGSLQQLDLFKSLSLKANFQFVACAQWDNKKGLFQGEASGQILVAADFTITENFFAGPIPVLISFSLNASFIAALNAACYSATKKKDEPIIDAIMDFGRWQWDYVNSGFTMTLALTPSLSVGVGIRGIASISVKGSITLSLFTGFKSKQVRETTKDLPNPHFTAGWSAQISLVLHLFLFTQSFVIKDFKFSNFYDNWEGKDKGVITAKSDEGAASLEAMSAGDLIGGMKIITDDMLRKTLDVKLNAQGMKVQSEGAADETADQGEPIDWDAHMREEVIPLEDGTPMTYLVYDLSATTSEKPTEGTATTGGSASAGGDQDGGTVLTEDEKLTTSAQADEVPLTENKPDTKTQGSSSTAAMSAALPFSLTTKAYADTTDDMTPDSAQDAKPTTGTNGQSQASAAQGTTGNGEMGVEPTATTATGAGDTAKDPVASTSGQEGELGYQETQASEQPETQGQELGQGTQQQSLEAQSDTSGEADGEWLVGMADTEQVKLDVAGLGTYGGIRPSADTKIFSNVFGDPRAKVVSIESVLQNKAVKLDLNIKATLSFRIASVQLADGKVRTRIVANVVDCNRAEERGLSRVIEFETKAGAGINHADLYDCDFDLDVINFTQKVSDGIFSLDMLCITVVSGRRKEGDGTKLADAATDLVFSCHVFRLMDILGYDIDGKKLPNATSVVRPPAGSSSFSMLGAQVTGSDKSYVHSISSLQLVREGTTLGDLKWIVSFLDRRTKDPSAVLGNEPGHLDIRLGVAIWDFSKNTFSPISTESTHQKLGNINDLSIFEHVLYPKIGSEYTLMLRGSDKAYYYLMRLDNGTLKDAKACAAYDSTARLTYWTNNNAFLVPYPTDKSQLQKSPGERDYSSWTLHKATWGGGNKPELQMTPVGPAGFNISAFALNQAGTFMFWPQAREADIDRVFDAEGTPDERKLEPSYHIMACRLWKGTFSDPFIVADLSHDTDVLAVLKTDHGAAVEMLSTEFVKGDEGLYTAANIWHTMVPGVRSATAVGCEAVSAFVSPGAKATFHVALRNDGNTFLKGCKLTLCVKQNDSDDFDRVESASSTVTFSKDTIQESNWNQMVNGKLTNIEPDYALAPGKTSVYAVSVTIPANWHGEKKVLFVASEPTKASEDKVDGITLQAQADGDDDVVEVAYSVDPGNYQVIQRRTAPDDDYGQRYMETIDVALASDEETFWQAPVTTPANDDGNDSGNVNGGGNGGSASGGSASGGSRSTLPRTDDHTSGALPLGIAVAGAGLVAYSRRRKHLENTCDAEG